MMALRQTTVNAAKILKPAMAAVASVRSKATLPDLPYDYNALEPVISADIMQLHHSKHHQTYVNNYNVAQEKLAEAVAKGKAPKQSNPEVMIRTKHPSNFLCYSRRRLDHYWAAGRPEVQRGRPHQPLDFLAKPLSGKGRRIAPGRLVGSHQPGLRVP